MKTGIIVLAFTLLTILFVAFIVTLVALWKRTSKKNLESSPSSPLDYARLRLAKGEISHEEFERIKKDLS